MSREPSAASERQWKLLLDFTNSIVSSLQLQDLLPTMSASIRRVLKSDSVWINLANRGAKNFRVMAQDFPEQKATSIESRCPWKSQLSEGFFGQANRWL